jgi:hypothetical protein
MARQRIVKCINADGLLDVTYLTLDKEYVVVGEQGDMYKIIDDSGKEGQYYKMRFTEVTFKDPNGDKS